MLKDEKYSYWMMLADYDLETVKVLINGGRWVYVTFLCHQAMERQLKGMYVYYTDKEAPKTHNISFLLRKLLWLKIFWLKRISVYWTRDRKNARNI